MDNGNDLPTHIPCLEISDKKHDSNKQCPNNALWHYLVTKHLDFRHENNSIPLTPVIPLKIGLAGPEKIVKNGPLYHLLPKLFRLDQLWQPKLVLLCQI